MRAEPIRQQTINYHYVVASVRGSQCTSALSMLKFCLESGATLLMWFPNKAMFEEGHIRIGVYSYGYGCC